MARSFTLLKEEREFLLERLATYHIAETFTVTSVTDCVGDEILGPRDRQRYVVRQLLNQLRKDGRSVLLPREEQAAAARARQEREQRVSNAAAAIKNGAWKSDPNAIPQELAQFAQLFSNFEPFPTRSRPSQVKLDAVLSTQFPTKPILTKAPQVLADIPATDRAGGGDRREACLFHEHCGHQRLATMPFCPTHLDRVFALYNPSWFDEMDQLRIILSNSHVSKLRSILEQKVSGKPDDDDDPEPQVRKLKFRVEYHRDGPGASKLYYIDGPAPRLTTELLEQDENDEFVLAWLQLRELYRRNPALLLFYDFEFVPLPGTLLPIPLELGMVSGDQSIQFNQRIRYEEERSAIREQLEKLGHEIHEKSLANNWLDRDHVNEAGKTVDEMRVLMRSLIKPQHALLNWHSEMDKALLEYLYSPKSFPRATKDSRVLYDREDSRAPELPQEDPFLFMFIKRLYPRLPKHTLSMVYSVVCEEQMAGGYIRWHQGLGDALALREIVITLLKDTILNDWLDQQVAAGRFRGMGVV